MDSWCIYVLRDPRDGAVRYVGRTNNTKRRLIGHLRDGRRHLPSKKGIWMHALLRLGLKPTIEVIEAGLGPGASSAEKRWIKHYKDLGMTLVNGTQGETTDKPEVIEHYTMYHLHQQLEYLLHLARKGPSAASGPRQLYVLRFGGEERKAG